MPTLGKYEIVRRLTDRGITARYLARTGGDTVVVYRLLPQLAEHPEVTRAFVGDARLAQALAHPNVLRVREVGKSADGVFFVGDYARGATLTNISAAAQQRGRPMDPGIAAAIIARLCSGLHEAHMLSNDEGIPLGLVHCSVGPDNVLVTRAGEVKLRAFGTGRAMTLAARVKAELLDGRSAYLSPEQCRGETIDPRTDIFSAGTLLCELLCGRSPFARATPAESRVAILAGTLPGELRSDVAAELATIVSRALALDRRQRYVTAQDMQVALDAAIRANQWAAGAPEIAAEINGLLGPPKAAARPPAFPGAARPADPLPAHHPPPGLDPDELEPEPDPDTDPGAGTAHGALFAVPTVRNAEAVAAAVAAAEADAAAEAATQHDAAGQAQLTGQDRRHGRRPDTEVSRLFRFAGFPPDRGGLDGRRQQRKDQHRHPSFCAFHTHP